MSIYPYKRWYAFSQKYILKSLLTFPMSMHAPGNLSERLSSLAYICLFYRSSWEIRYRHHAYILTCRYLRAPVPSSLGVILVEHIYLYRIDVRNQFCLRIAVVTMLEKIIPARILASIVFGCGTREDPPLCSMTPTMFSQQGSSQGSPITWSRQGSSRGSSNSPIIHFALSSQPARIQWARILGKYIFILVWNFLVNPDDKSQEVDRRVKTGSVCLQSSLQNGGQPGVVDDVGFVLARILEMIPTIVNDQVSEDHREDLH